MLLMKKLALVDAQPIEVFIEVMDAELNATDSS